MQINKVFGIKYPTKFSLGQKNEFLKIIINEKLIFIYAKIMPYPKSLAGCDGFFSLMTFWNVERVAQCYILSVNGY